VGNYDTRLMTIVAVVVGLVAMLSDLMLRLTRFGAGMRMGNRDKGGGAIALIIIVVAVIFIAISPIIASIMRLALSRQREYLADASGALLSRNRTRWRTLCSRSQQTASRWRWRTRRRHISTSRTPSRATRASLTTSSPRTHRSKSVCVYCGRCSVVEIALRPARTDDIPAIETLLKAEWLPPMAIAEFLDSFWVLDSDGRVLGCAGIEIYGGAAVLRSVVVALDLRGTGAGDRLVRHGLDYAREHGAQRVYLFTMHAAPFFARYGFQPVTTDDFEPSVRGSWQYIGLTERPEILSQMTPMRLQM
jgi:N-acetylglutamate synthase-like GNAT family acetyltransferase